MGLFNFIVALFLLGLALTLLIYLSWLIASPLLGGVRGKKSSGKVGKANKKLQKVDNLIANGKPNEALKLLRKAVMLDAGLTHKVLGELKEHHQNVLSRCLVIAEELGSRAENIAQAERALMERVELQSLLIKANESFKNLKNRREQAGKDLPSWSKSDFQTRIKDIEKELASNEKVANEAIEALFARLASPTGDSDDNDIVYH